MKASDWHDVLGIHWMVDAVGCSAPRVGDVVYLKEVVTGLCHHLSLTRVGEVQTFEHADPQTGERSLGGLALISESHLSIHVRPELRTIHADIFSCKPFEKSEALWFMKSAYGFADYQESIFRRGEIP